MKFLKGLGNAIAGIFGVEEKVARVATDPRVSEPVFMMLQSIKKNPHHWRVKFVMPVSYNDALNSRHPMHWSGSVKVVITDRHVGECYEARLRIDDRLATNIMRCQFYKRPLDDYMPIAMASVCEGPDWLNPQELNALEYAIKDLVVQRMAKIIKHRGRETQRAEKAAKVRIEFRREQERQRLINVYGAHND